VFFVLVAIGAALDQAIGVACAVCLYYAVTQPLFVFAVYRRVGVTARQVAGIYLWPTGCAAAAVGAGLALSKLPAFATHPLMRAAIICAVAGPAYAALVRWLAPDVWRELSGRISSGLQRRMTA